MNTPGFWLLSEDTTHLAESRTAEESSYLSKSSLLMGLSDPKVTSS